jgi:hypothetical protein
MLMCVELKKEKVPSKHEREKRKKSKKINVNSQIILMGENEYLLSHTRTVYKAEAA